MATRTEQNTRYWPTPAACAVLGGHRPDETGSRCMACNSALVEVRA